ncbi:MAG: DUF2283 domain-containing protein [Candidatus Omnitrophica bacterium]|nr:DUF2283 domain-containing protein [Candidatus Omnitrophota bacterium]
MEIAYDIQAKAAYIKLSDDRVAKTIEYADFINLDLDDKGQLVGIELLWVRPRQVAVQIHRKLNQLAREYHMPELRRLHPEKLAEILQPA